MGLDMYLSKKTYVKNWDYMSESEKIKIDLSGNTKGIKTNRISHIEEEVMYWRKANQIHSWFVKNVQDGEDDCREYELTRSDLELLLETCKEVKKSGYNPEVCENLLPTESGFFFGSTVLPNTPEGNEEEEVLVIGGENYKVKKGQFYIDDMEDTIEVLEEALKDSGEYPCYYYRACW
jgi:hypothetical protein